MMTVPINIHNEVIDMTKQERKAAALELKVKHLAAATKRAREELKEAKVKMTLPEPTNTIKAPKMKAPKIEIQADKEAKARMKEEQ